MTQLHEGSNPSRRRLSRDVCLGHVLKRRMDGEGRTLHSSLRPKPRCLLKAPR